MGNQRLAVLGPQGPVAHESRLYGGPYAAAPVRGRALVVGFLVSDSLEMAEYGPREEGVAAIPPAFHFVSAEGEILRSFGEWVGYPQPPAATAIGDTAFLDGSDLLYSPRQGPEGYVVMNLWRASVEDRAP